MMPLVEFPNTVLWVTTYLRAALLVNGYPDTPSTVVRVADTYIGADREVWVQRDGGPVLDVVREAARIRVNVFAKGATSGPVDDLARRVSTLMRAAADGNPVLHVTQLSGPTSIEDVIPRRYLLFDVLTRGTQL